MKKTLQFALPLLVPAALLLGMPSFSQGNGQRGDRGGNGRGNGGAARQEQRMGGMDRGSQNRGGINQSRAGGQQRSAASPNRAFETQRSPARVYNPSGQSPQVSRNRTQDRSFEQRNPGRVNSPGNQSPQRNLGSINTRDRNYGSSPATRPGGVRNPSPNMRDRVYSGSSRSGRYNSPNSGRYDNRSISSRPGNNRYSSRPYQSPVRWNYRYPTYGKTYTRLSVGYRTIPFGGFNYHYYGGIWYRPFGSYYRVIAPPTGISINILPFGYTRFYVGPNPYYYYGGIYYMPRNNGYTVVDPPLGAKLPALPGSARETFINGQRLFEDNGTYYMEEYNIQNQRLYTVVGVHGVLDQGQVDQISQGLGSNASYDGVITVLPSNSRRVTISGQEYYLSPEDVYYQEITDGSNVSYQVVGM
jgi:hypothetical protein